MRILSILILILSSFPIYAQDTLDLEQNNVLIRSDSTPKSLPVIERSIVVKSLESNAFKTHQNLFRRSPSSIEASQMDEEVEKLRKINQNSFEYNYLKYISGNYDVSLFSFLQKAKELKPNSPDVLIQMAAYYIIQQDSIQIATNLQTIFDEGIVSNVLVAYANDLLMSVPKNGRLITHGIEDTYAVIFLQQNKAIRADVEVVSLELLQSKTYRDDLKKKHFKLPNSTFIDTAYYVDFLQLNEDMNISTSLTVPKEYLRNVSSNLFVTGLVMRFSTQKIDNLNVNINLWKYELTFSILENKDSEKSREISSNYLPMLFQLRYAYRMMDEVIEVKKIDQLIDRIAIFCGKEEMVKRLKLKF